MSTPESAVLLDLNQVQERIPLGLSHLRVLVAKGTIPSVNIGRRRLVPSRALDEYIASLESEAGIEYADQSPSPSSKNRKS